MTADLAIVRNLADIADHAWTLGAVGVVLLAAGVAVMLWGRRISRRARARNGRGGR